MNNDMLEIRWHAEADRLDADMAKAESQMARIGSGGDGRNVGPPLCCLSHDGMTT